MSLGRVGRGGFESERSAEHKEEKKVECMIERGVLYEIYTGISNRI